MAHMYFVTISPRARLLDPMELYHQDTHTIRQLFNQFSKHYCFYPEFAKNTCRLHYHGIVRVDDRLKYCKIKWKIDITIGLTKFDKILNPTAHLRALLYSMKDWRVNVELFQEPIMYKRLRRTPMVRQVKELDNNILQYLAYYDRTEELHFSESEKAIEI